MWLYLKLPHWFTDMLVMHVLQVVKVHQLTVDAYLEDIVSAAVDSTANAEARQDIQQMAAVINDAAYDAQYRSLLLAYSLLACCFCAIIVYVCCIVD